MRRLPIRLTAGLLLTLAAPALAQAQSQPAASLIESQAAANTARDVRKPPAKTIPVPTADVSPQAQALIGNPYSPTMNAAPADAAAWHQLIDGRAAIVAATVPALAEQMGVTVEPATMAGVKVYIVTPKTLPEANRNRLLIHVHGGAYVFFPGLSGTTEAILMAGFGGYKIISVDYRMPPDFPYPAAMDDAMAVYKEALKTNDPRRVAVFGTSTGGGMTLAMMLRAKAEGVALPAAMAPGTPWSDLDKIGDSYQTNEWIDNVLVSWDGVLGRAAKLYAGGHDFKDPQLSPIYGDYAGLPPAILTSGTRDMFLSNTVRVHRKLRRAGVEADLNVYEGQSHAQYQADYKVPETKEAFTDIAKFFDKHLQK